MNALELLNVLDIIKNEEVYTKRLDLLKAEQARLEEVRLIADTVKRAKDLEVKARLKFEDLAQQKTAFEKYMAEERKKLIVERDRMSTDNTNKLEQVNSLRRDAVEKFQQAKIVEADSLQRMEKAEEFNRQNREKEAKFQKLESFYMAKLANLRSLVTNELQE